MDLGASVHRELTLAVLFKELDVEIEGMDVEGCFGKLLNAQERCVGTGHGARRRERSERTDHTVSTVAHSTPTERVRSTILYKYCVRPYRVRYAPMRGRGTRPRVVSAERDAPES